MVNRALQKASMEGSAVRSTNLQGMMLRGFLESAAGSRAANTPIKGHGAPERLLLHRRVPEPGDQDESNAYDAPTCNPPHI